MINPIWIYQAQNFLTEIPRHMEDTGLSFCEGLLPWSPSLPGKCWKPVKDSGRSVRPIPLYLLIDQAGSTGTDRLPVTNHTYTSPYNTSISIAAKCPLPSSPCIHINPGAHLQRYGVKRCPGHKIPSFINTYRKRWIGRTCSK